MAEAHPVGFQWVMEAKERGATVIHVDPRFTRTSALADLHVPIRAGADIAFVGGLINYVLRNEKYFLDYILAYTNASAILTEDYADTEDLDGVFSGLNREHRLYERTRAGTVPRRSCTAWAGPSIRSASSTSAPRPSCRRCSAT
jgi:formate dehydrogenase major subunit